MLRDVRFPTRGTLRTSHDGIRGDGDEPTFAVVMDNCCTVEQTSTVLLARVGRKKRPQAGSRTELALRAVEPLEGQDYTPYEHVLEPLDPHMPESSRWWVVKLVDRLALSGDSLEDLGWLNELRVARMTVPARVRFRLKIANHFGREVNDDSEWLEAQGLDGLGRPLSS